MHPTYAIRDHIGIENLRKLDASKVELPEMDYKKFRERPLGKILSFRLNSVDSRLRQTIALAPIVDRCSRDDKPAF
jgi:hypothetical protein